jgi:hypothetical protein
MTVERTTRPNGRIPHLDVIQAVDVCGKPAKRVGRSAVYDRDGRSPCTCQDAGLDGW